MAYRDDPHGGVYDESLAKSAPAASSAQMQVRRSPMSVVSQAR